MNILAIESSSTVCGVALFLNENMVQIDEVNIPRIHGEYLPSMIDSILKTNKIKASDLDGIAVSEGPGSYTGLRIGISLAKGLSVAYNIPIIPISSLESMNKGIDKKGTYWVVLYSHKNIVFSQKFKDGITDSEIRCEEFSLKRYNCIIGFNLESICDSNKYDNIIPSSKYIGEIAIKRFSELVCL